MMNLKNIYLVRHAQSEHHINGYSGGWSDFPLTPYGIKQAEQLREIVRPIIAKEDIKILSSDLSRARQTTQILTLDSGVACHFTQELRELNNGIAAKLTKKEAKLVVQEETKPALDWIPYQEGESWRMLQQRVARFLDAYSDVPSLFIICHANTIVAIIQWWLRLSLDTDIERIMFRANPASISKLGTDKMGCRVVELLNWTPVADLS